MATGFFGSTRRATPGEFYRCTTLRDILGQSPLPKTTPTGRHADTPTRRHADRPTGRQADTPTRRHADTPTRRHADTPLGSAICHSALGAPTSWVPRLSGLNGVVDG